MPFRGHNRALDIVNTAAAGGYAVPAMCCFNLEGILATVKAAEAKRSPAIIQLFPCAIEFADGLLIHAAKEAADKASVPVAVHMDHAQSPGLIRHAAELGGFDGIMEENLAKTKELTSFLHSKGIIVEAEPGRINGGEDGVADTEDLEGILTTPEQAEEFISLGIDWLAPAFGSVHGKYDPKGPQLDLERLERIHETACKGGIQLVLHGAAGFDEKLYGMCIKRGVAKVNINGAMNSHFTAVLAETGWQDTTN
ncbi:unnamed protein product [Clonostachys chloroleuca]|uniref:Fructose-bisphosphate aldolase n=1 Tax=Clonostachys chloroleuca TaxID=1926264 RepID=A0AA35MHK7_9HYPO|nr:unnamed protein product [Clonostachys chloroleuca]